MQNHQPSTDEVQVSRRRQMEMRLRLLLLRLAEAGPLLLIVADKIAHLFGIELGFH